MIFQFPSGYLIFEMNDVSYTSKIPENYKDALDNEGIIIKQNQNSISMVDTNIYRHIIMLSNIGLHSATDVTIGLKSSNGKILQEVLMPPFHLKCGEEVILNLIFDTDYVGKFLITVVFYDIYGEHRYEQECVLNHFKETPQFEMSSITCPRAKT